MPVIFRFRALLFSFYSNEHLPIHVHVKHAGKHCRVELGTLAVSQVIGFSNREVSLIRELVRKNDTLIRKRWQDKFGPR